MAVRAALRRPPGDAAPPSTPSQATRLRPSSRSPARGDKVARRLLWCRLRRSAVTVDDHINPAQEW